MARRVKPSRAKRQRSQATEDPINARLRGLATEIHELERCLSAPLTRADERQIRRVGNLMLAASDGVSEPVLLMAILRMAAFSVVAIEALRQIDQAMTTAMPTQVRTD